jgi:hypothetical protein
MLAFIIRHVQLSGTVSDWYRYPIYFFSLLHKLMEVFDRALYVSVFLVFRINASLGHNCTLFFQFLASADPPLSARPFWAQRRWHAPETANSHIMVAALSDTLRLGDGFIHEAGIARGPQRNMRWSLVPVRCAARPAATYAESSPGKRLSGVLRLRT